MDSVSDPYRDLSVLAKAFSDPNRLFILERLAQTPCSVEQLAEKTDLPIGNLSHHLQILKRAGMATSRRQGKNIIYALSGPAVVEALQGLRRLHAGMGDLDTRLRASGLLPNGPAVRRADALRLIKEGRALLLDVRPKDEYSAGHIRGAINIPLEELETGLAALPHDKMIVTYCRGPYCQLSVRASERLALAGMQAAMLEDGYPEWWAEGNPVETGLQA